MTEQEIQLILDKITYKSGWQLEYSWDKNDRYIQWQFDDNFGTHWHCRKWRISVHMTPSELIQTCFMAAMAAEEHECREAFLYKGCAVLSPHHDLDVLADNIVTGLQRESTRDPQVAQG